MQIEVEIQLKEKPYILQEGDLVLFNNQNTEEIKIVKFNTGEYMYALESLVSETDSIKHYSTLEALTKSIESCSYTLFKQSEYKIVITKK